MSQPAKFIEVISRWVKTPWPGLSDFERAVLENNLKEAFARADLESRAALYEIVKWCYWEIPSNCWGSHEKVEAWIAKGQAHAATG